MNQKQLERKVKYWQKILKLDHWNITSEITDSFQLDGSGGDVKVEAEYFKAHIRILDPKYFNTPSVFEDDKRFEVNLIHELLHCHTNPLTAGSSDHHRKEEERCVTLLSRVIYDLHKEIYE